MPTATPMPTNEQKDLQPPYVEVKDLEARYGDRKVLDGVSLTARRGEITVILGPSGCGKSTLLRHIIGLNRPVAGQVLINDRDLHHATEDERDDILRGIGISFQGGALFNSMSLQDNVALPIMEHTGADKETAGFLALMKLALVGLEGAAHRLPSEISGGMKKRAALARALALDPALLLFDEPSAGLDPVTSRELDELILRLRDQFGMAIIVVTHELSSIETIADQAVMLDRGKVLAYGPLKEVSSLSQPQVRAFFDRKARSGGFQHALLDAVLLQGA